MPSGCAAFTSALCLRSERTAARSRFSTASASGDLAASDPGAIDNRAPITDKMKHGHRGRYLCPEGAKTNQPKATPWVNDAHKRASPERAKRLIARSEEHTSELQSQSNLVCRLLLEKKKQKKKQ